MLKNVKSFLKNKKKPVFAAMLVLTILITGALAILTDTDSAKNIFTVGNVDIEILEPNWVESDAQEIVPKQEIVKDPLIKNTGENNAYVYIGLWVPKLDGVKITTDEPQDDGTYLKTENDFELFNYVVNNGWTELTQYRSQDPEQSYNYYLYAYDTALAPKTQSGSLFDKVVVKDLVSGFETLLPEYSNIVVQGFAIQSDFYNNEATDAESAWTLFVNQNGFEWPNKPVPNTVSFLSFDRKDRSVQVYDSQDNALTIPDAMTKNLGQNAFLGYKGENGVLYSSQTDIQVSDLYIYDRMDYEFTTPLNLNPELVEVLRYENPQQGDGKTIMLVPYDDAKDAEGNNVWSEDNPCPTIVDRGGQLVNEYVDGVSEWFVYGFKTMIKEDEMRNYFTVQGDGRYEFEYRDDQAEGYPGTGCKINVYDRKGTDTFDDDTLVESIYVVIFGDINGDCYINAVDVTCVEDACLGIYKYYDKLSSDYCPAKTFASDVNYDKLITISDVDYVTDTSLGSLVLDQTNGCGTRRFK